uniref:Uncharacterized protein n=1 Tax=Tetranychus urticae TaxID=32264 RepID=T1JXB7_TETUR
MLRISGVAYATGWRWLHGSMMVVMVRSFVAVFFAQAVLIALPSIPKLELVLAREEKRFMPVLLKGVFKTLYLHFFAL